MRKPQLTAWTLFLIGALLVISYSGLVPGLLISLCFGLAIVAYQILGKLDALALALGQGPKGKADEEDSFSDKEESSRDDEEPFCLELTDEELNEHSGWERIEVFPFQKRYCRQFCIGGPPVEDEVWEYDIREQVVFVRLKDASETGFYSPRFGAVNGCVLEENLRNQYLGEEDIARYRRDVVWHESTDAFRYFILGKSRSTQTAYILSRELSRFQKAFAEFDEAATKVGVARNKWGVYSAPEDATEEQNSAVSKLLSDENLLKRYGLSREDLRQREKILEILAKACSRAAGSGSSD